MPDFVLAFIERQRARLADPLIAHSNEARSLGAQLDQLEAEYELHMEAALSARDAAAESGYSEDNIRLLRRRGIISDRRRDLPRKPGHGVEPRRPQAAPDRSAAGVRSIADRVMGRSA